MPKTLIQSLRFDVLAAAFLCLAATSASAADRSAHPPGPPPEAIAACSGKAASDACQVTFGDHTESGTCATFGDGPLACRPAHRPPHHGPPPEAIDACKGDTEGAACAVTLGGNTLDGTCTTESGGEIACRPSQMPPPPSEP